MITSTLLRQLRAFATQDSARAKSIGFIGLGRMGSEMAFNLFSKTFAEAHDSQFIICDTVPESTRTFRHAFLERYPAASVHIALTPGE
jgi:3-hydroxyisobutyrate dehydrogenase